MLKLYLVSASRHLTSRWCKIWSKTHLTVMRTQNSTKRILVSKPSPINCRDNGMLRLVSMVWIWNASMCGRASRYKGGSRDLVTVRSSLWETCEFFGWANSERSLHGYRIENITLSLVNFSCKRMKVCIGYTTIRVHSQGVYCWYYWDSRSRWNDAFAGKYVIWSKGMNA